jgi:molecular chaperone GrpE
MDNQNKEVIDESSEKTKSEVNCEKLEKDEKLEENEFEEVATDEIITKEECKEEECKKDSAKNEVLEANEKLNRVMAEYANYRKRTEKEKQELSVFANEKIMSQILPILDNFDRALDSYEGEEEHPFYKGVLMIQQELIKVLDSNGLKEIESLNKEFNPNVHLAVMHEEKENVDPDIVTEVFQKGYQLKEKVLRASMVKVSK